VELVRRRARLDGGERGVGEGGEIDGRGGAAAEETGWVKPARGAAERAAGVAAERARRVRRGREGERGVPPVPAPEEEDEGEQEQQRRRNRRGGGDAGEEGLAEEVVVVPFGQGRRRRRGRRERLLEEEAGRHGSGAARRWRRGRAGRLPRRVGSSVLRELMGVACIQVVYSRDILYRVSTSSSHLTVSKQERYSNFKIPKKN